jgi:hypothetical protein
MEILLVCFIILILYPITVFTQSKKEIRFPHQHYIEDSTDVFWTWYPNPFSPPTITDSTKRLFCGQYSFYCDISDTVLIAFQNEVDSIVYSVKIIAKVPQYFSFCTWIAGSLFTPKELPKFYFRGKGADMLKLVLIVDGRKKCYTKFSISDKRYYWINSD